MCQSSQSFRLIARALANGRWHWPGSPNTSPKWSLTVIITIRLAFTHTLGAQEKRARRERDTCRCLSLIRCVYIRSLACAFSPFCSRRILIGAFFSLVATNLPIGLFLKPGASATTHIHHHISAGLLVGVRAEKREKQRERESESERERRKARPLSGIQQHFLQSRYRTDRTPVRTSPSHSRARDAPILTEKTSAVGFVIRHQQVQTNSRSVIKQHDTCAESSNCVRCLWHTLGPHCSAETFYDPFRSIDENSSNVTKQPSIVSF